MVSLVCIPTTNQSTRDLTPVCRVCIRLKRCYDTISRRTSAESSRKSISRRELGHSDNYLSGGEFYTKKPIRKSLWGPSLVYANVLRLLKPQRDKLESPWRHVFRCKRNGPFNCMLHLHMHHFAGMATTLRRAPTRRRQTALRGNASLCKSARGDTTTARHLIRSQWPILLKAIF